MYRIVCTLCLTALACGGGGGTPDDPDERARASGPFSFTASADEVDPCRTVSLGWNAPEVDVVNIEVGGVTLIATYDQRGTVVSPPICETTTFELTARGAGGTRVATITVTPAWEPAAIGAFSRDAQFLLVNDTVTLNWRAANAARILLTRNDEVLFDRALTPQDVLTTEDLPVSRQALVKTTTTTFILTASNPISTASSELEVVAKPHGIRRFSISPPAGSPGDRITVTWDVDGSSTMLIANGLPVTAFPGTIAGTFEMIAPPQTAFELWANIDTPFGERTINGFLPFSEPVQESEPNDERLQSTILGFSSASGTLSPGGDVDFYAAGIGPPIRIWTAPRTGTVCTLFPTLTIYDDVGVELGQVAGSTTAEGPICSVFDAELHPFLEELQLGSVYTLSVSGDGVQTGDYVLFIENNVRTF